MASKVMGEELERASRQGTTDEILRLWRENGAALDVEHKDRFYGLTPLSYAAAEGHEEACCVLVSTCGANVDSRNEFGRTPLFFAASYNRLQCIEVLLELGADITFRDAVNKTALEWAREKGHVEVTALLESAAITMVKSANKV